MSIESSGLYWGRVVHERQRPKKHRLSYSVFSLLINLDELETLNDRFRLLSYNKAAFFSIYDKDHGSGSPIRNWVSAELRRKWLEAFSSRITMLCYPRILGYVFNPLTVFFCYDTGGQIGAIVYEVHNTFNERRAYVLPVPQNSKEVVRQSCDKDFYVSPFIPMDCRYQFRVQPPSDHTRVVIREEDSEGLLLAAAFSGRHRQLTDQNLLRTAIKYPLMTIKVIVGIHWEAVRLLLKAAPYFSHSKSALSRSRLQTELSSTIRD